MAIRKAVKRNLSCRGCGAVGALGVNIALCSVLLLGGFQAGVAAGAAEPRLQLKSAGVLLERVLYQWPASLKAPVA